MADKEEEGISIFAMEGKDEEEIYQIALKWFPNHEKLARNYARNKLRQRKEESDRTAKLVNMKPNERKTFLEEEKNKQEEWKKIVSDV